MADDLAQAVGRPRERACAEREEAQRRFVATAAHELRTPITSLHVMLDLLEDALAGDEPDLADAREQVTRANALSARVAALCRDLLDLTRLETGVPMRRERVELRDATRTVIAEFPRAVGRVDIDPRAASAVWALADPSGVAQILRILVENGLRFAPAGTRLTIGVREGQGHAEIAVSNAGPAIAGVNRDRIFQRFERGCGPQEDSGFGLGLAIGRELARRMGGELRLDAAAWPTRFVVELPSGRRDRFDA
jgi:signal transduction histidine kinase